MNEQVVKAYEYDMYFKSTSKRCKIVDYQCGTDSAGDKNLDGTWKSSPFFKMDQNTHDLVISTLKAHDGHHKPIYYL